MDGIHISKASGRTVAESEVEIVERKGIGQPDTICDAIMEEVSRSLYVGSLVGVRFAEPCRARTPLLVDTPTAFKKVRFG